MKVSLYNKTTKGIEEKSKIKRIHIFEDFIVMDSDLYPKEYYSIVILENEEDMERSVKE